MSVTVLDGQTPFVLPLTIPAEVVNGVIQLTPESIGTSGGGAGAFTNVSASGTLSVTGISSLAGNVSVGGGRFAVTAASGNTSILGTLTVASASTLGSLAVTTTATVGTTLSVTGAVTAGAALTVTGVLTANGGITSVLPTYANNAAAILGGLVANQEYKTATGERRIVV